MSATRSAWEFDDMAELLRVLLVKSVFNLVMGGMRFLYLECLVSLWAERAETRTELRLLEEALREALGGGDAAEDASAGNANAPAGILPKDGAKLTQVVPEK